MDTKNSKPKLTKIYTKIVDTLPYDEKGAPYC